MKTIFACALAVAFCAFPVAAGAAAKATKTSGRSHAECQKKLQDRGESPRDRGYARKLNGCMKGL